MTSRSSSPPASVGPVSLETLDELQDVYARLKLNLDTQVNAVLASIKPGSEDDNEAFREQVRKLVAQDFYNDLQRVIQLNVTIGGRTHEEHLAQKSTELEPFNEQLNRTVLTYQIKVHDVVCDNCNKRKEGPKKAMAQIETASSHFGTARDKDSENMKLEREAMRFDPNKVCNCVIPDKDTVASQWAEALTTIDQLATSLPSLPAQLDEPIQVQADIAKLRQPSN